MIEVSGETSECLYEAGDVRDEREARRSRFRIALKTYICMGIPLSRSMR